MAQLNIDDSDVDIVIAAIRPNLSEFLEAWRSVFSRFHLIIIKDPNLQENVEVPPGFYYDIYTKSEIEQVLKTNSINFSGHSCRYFGYLVSRKKYVISIDDDCLPAKDNNGELVDAVAQHIFNLQTPATPFFFNTLYDPYRKGADFVRGYPFSLREGVNCVVSCGLWLNVADYDPLTRIVKLRERNNRYVDAVMTVPQKAMLPVSGINIGFNREVIGPALFPGLRLPGDGTRRWQSLEDIWCGMCAKAICDHLGLGMKTGLPYVWRSDGGGSTGVSRESMKEWNGVKLMEEVVPFFESVKLPKTAVTAEDCVVAIAGMVRDQLGSSDTFYVRVAEAMEEWVKLWKSLGSQGV